jgi:hypothetical protein
MKQPKIKRNVRSFRIRSDLMAEAKRKNINFTQFAEDMLEQYLHGHITCPVCKKKVGDK